MPYKDKERGRINQRERTRKWRERHPEDSKRRDSIRYWLDPEAAIDKAKKWYWDNREVALEGAKTRNQMRLYGLPRGVVEALMQRPCDICKSIRGEGKSRFHIDHDHETGQLRGVLCPGCNTGLGAFRSNPDTLRKAAAYLEIPRA